jgi:hypothetical protein
MQMFGNINLIKHFSFEMFELYVTFSKKLSDFRFTLRRKRFNGPKLATNSIGKYVESIYDFSKDKV